MIQKLEMTVLIDNVAGEPLAGEWGLSILIIADGRKILLDTGSSGLFARNADCQGIDLGSVDIFTGHCTGDHAFSFLKERLGERIGQFSSGFRYFF